MAISSRWLGRLTLLYGLLVVYGSLVPLQWQALPFTEAWARFQQIPFLTLGIESRADWVANGVLYLPLGVLLRLALRPLGHGAAPAALVGGALLAVGVEFLQLWFPQRTVSLNDLAAEVIGTALGVALAPLVAQGAARLAEAWQRRPEALLPRLLTAYALGYAALSFFPYDLLLSASELQAKLNSPAVGVWWAGGERSWFMASLQTAVELLLVLPLGAWPALHAAGRPRWGKAALAGGVLGLLVEGGQLLVATGVSQGASVLTRAAGVALGAWVWSRLRLIGWSGLRQAISRGRWPLALVYLPLLAAASGLLRRRWHGWEAAAQSLADTHWLPFYYHYFTTEAQALTSLASVSLLYGPVGLLVWASGGRARWAAVGAGLLALGVESARLFVPGSHPDPTNLGVAALAAALVVWALEHLGGHAERAAPRAAFAAGASARIHGATPAAPAAVQPSSASGGSVTAALGLLLGPALVVWVVAAPWQPWALGLGLLLAGLVVRSRPFWALTLWPLAWAVLDTTFWTGRRFIDEFDALTAVMAWAVVAARPGGWTRARQALRQPLGWAALAVIGALVVSALQGSGAFGSAVVGELVLYAGPWAPWWVAKGAVQAALLAGCWWALAPGDGEADQRPAALAVGCTLGLAALLSVVLWERWVFTGWWDAQQSYRVTGLFSAMHKGGATIECALVVLSAFTLHTALDPARGRVLRAAAAGVSLGAVYGVWVTYSRGGYAAWAVAVSAVALVVWRASVVMGSRDASEARGSGDVRPPHPRGLRAAVPLLSAAGLLGLGGVLMGQGLALDRLTRSAPDLQVRADHWADAVALRRDDALSTWFGEGLGRFPEAHLWRSREPVRAARFAWVTDARPSEAAASAARAVPALRLGAGAPLYVEQVVDRPAVPALTLRLEARAVAGGPEHPVALLCEKWTLTSRTCAEAGPWQRVGAPAAPGAPAAGAPSAWQRWEAPINASTLLTVPTTRQALFKFALVTPEQGVVEVRAVSLRSGLGDELLANGDFRAGLERWFWSTDRDPPWLIHNLPVHLWFEQGWLGVAAWTWLLGGAVLVGAGRLWRARAVLPAAWPALMALLACGLLNTLIDEPRMLAALLLLAWSATGVRPEGGRQVAQP